MVRESLDILKNLTRSLGKFLLEETYLKSGVTKTLKGFYASPSLAIILEYPPDLTKISLPTIALSYLTTEPKGAGTFGEHYIPESYNFNIYGFAGGNSSDRENQLQRDGLISDVKCLIENVNIDLYDWSTVSTPVKIGTAWTPSARAENISPSGSIKAERFKFLVSFQVVVLQEE